MRLSGYCDTIEFYADANNHSVIYAEFVVPAIGASTKPRKMFEPIDSPKLKSFIRQFILPNIDDKLSDSDVVEEMRDILTLGGNPDVVTPRVRTAGQLKDGLIEYDLNNFADEYVRITLDGWDISKKHKHKFLKRSMLGTQVIPKDTDKSPLELLSPFINADKDSKLLFLAWLIQAFGIGNHNALLVMAEAGSGKSTLTKMIRQIIDPSQLQVNILPEKKDDLLVALSNSYFVAFDNTETLSKATSDILCAAITGATMAKRMLYSTNDLGAFELHNTIVMNGIDVIPVQSDLASRCLLLKLKPINEQNRKTDDVLEQAFEQSLPYILGAVFNTLSKAMTILPTLDPKRLPRMASAYIEMLAIAMALGVSEYEFERIYFANIELMDKERANVAIVEAVQEYMNSDFVKGRAVEGKVSEIYKKIYASYSGCKRGLPQSPSQFSRKLKQESKTFDSVGLTVNFDDTFADGTHIKIIKNK